MQRTTRLLRAGLLLVGGVLLSLTWTWQRALGQAGPDAAKPKAILVDGQTALSLDYGDGMGFLMVYTKFHDKPVFRFTVAMVERGHTCGGYLWATSGAVTYTPDPSANQKACTPQTSISPPYTLAASDAGSYSIKEGKYPWFNFFYDGSAKDNLRRWSHGDKQMAETALAGKIAQHWLELAFTDFPAAEKKFFVALGGMPIAATTEEVVAMSRAATAGQSQEKSGNLVAAFTLYQAALADLPPNTTGPEVDSLRQNIFALATKLSPRPAIPDDAQRYFFGSQAALEEWKDNGDTAKLDDAVEQLNEALRIAPWWPEAYFNRGLVLEDRGRYADAVESFKLYLLAAPNASDAQQVKQKIYMLEYKVREAEAQK